MFQFWRLFVVGGACVKPRLYFLEKWRKTRHHLLFKSWIDVWVYISHLSFKKIAIWFLGSKSSDNMHEIWARFASVAMSHMGASIDTVIFKSPMLLHVLNVQADVLAARAKLFFSGSTHRSSSQSQSSGSTLIGHRPHPDLEGECREIATNIKQVSLNSAISIIMVYNINIIITYLIFSCKAIVLNSQSCLL